MKFALVVWSAGCGGSAINLVHGGGDAVVTISPVAGEGLTLEATMVGATEAELFEGRFDGCVVYTKEWEKSTGLERTVQVCADEIVATEAGCFDAFTFWLRATEAPDLSHGVWMGKSGSWNGEADEIEVAVTTEDWEGTSEGSYVADVTLANACLGAEPVPHLLEVRWSFPDTYDEIVPRDDDPGNKPFDPVPIWGR